MPFWPETKNDDENETCEPWPASIADRREEWEQKAREVEDDDLLQAEARRQGRDRKRVLPIDAEHWAAEMGLPPFVKQVKDPAKVFDWHDTSDLEWGDHRTWMPLSLALMWVAFKDRERAGWAWERYQVWVKRSGARKRLPGRS